VTLATPVPPGVQVVKAVSQCPAHAKPLGATFKIAVSLDTKVKLVVRLIPLAVCAEAVKANVSPKLTEELADGRRFTFAGNSGGPALVLLPHPLIFQIERIATVNRKAFASDLPMHPSLNIALALHPEARRNDSSNELENL
jgi:hypothetical protein